jgi:hypothetical protein
VGDHPRIAGESVRQLAATDIDGVDATGAALEEDVRETTRGSARVQAHEPARVDRERVEGGCELVAAAADVSIPLRDADREAEIDQVARLAIRPHGVALARPDLAGEDQRLRLRARVGEATLDEELVQPPAQRS